MIFRVLLLTRSCVKILGPVLDAALERGHTLDLRVGSTPFRETIESGDTLPSWWAASSRTEHTDATIAVRLEDIGDQPGLKVVVPYFWEFLYQPVMAYSGVMLCYPSEEARRRHDGYRHPVTGWTIADHANLYRRGVGPRDSHIFFSMKRDVPRQHHVPYLRIAIMDRALAHRRGLRWIIKTRPKHKDPLWLRWLADEIWGDGQMYPHTSHVLLANAASMSHFTSGAVSEAVLHNVPTLWYRSADHRHHLATHQRQPDAYLQPWLMDKPTYVKRFLGWDDGHNGARVIEAIEQRVH